MSELRQEVMIGPDGSISYFEPSRTNGFTLNLTSVASELKQRRATNIHRMVCDNDSYYIVEILAYGSKSYYIKQDGRLSEDIKQAKKFKHRNWAITAELEFGQGKLRIIDGQSYIDCEGYVDA